MSSALVWFRRDLSLDDNLAWSAATSEHAEVVPVFVIDRSVLDTAGPSRVRQLHANVAALDEEVRAAGGSLTVLAGEPAEVIPRFARERGAVAVAWNDDVTAYARRRDGAVRRALDAAGIGVSASWSTFVHPPGTLLTNAGSVPRVFTRFLERWRALPVPPPAPVGGARIARARAGAIAARPDDAPLAPGAAGARGRLESFLDRVDRYDGDRDRPDLDATSHLSVDTHFGTVSPRALVRAAGFASAGRSAFVRQLAWRDWFGHLFAEDPGLGWRAQQRKYDAIAWNDDPEEIAAWKEGRTGFPIVDAAMRELTATGWMHNRLRMVAASFLVKDLLVDWRIGERHFRRLLLDGDVAQNAGNWQWVAGTGPDAAPYFRVLNPLTQARRFDPDGAYVRRWVLELAGIDGAAIHAPWELPPLERAAAGVSLGETYPEPIVDHAFARERVLAAYAAARR